MDSDRVRAIAQRGSRAAILRAGESERVARVVSRHGMRLGADRFVPAETLEELVPVFRRLNAAGMRGVTGLFDDHALAPADVARHAAEYGRQIDRLADEGLDANVGLKLTHLGVHFDAELMHDTVAQLLARADVRGMFLRIDMEESTAVDATLDLYRRLRAEGVGNVGVVLQSYLLRAERDLEALLELEPSVRLVKGAYLEPAAVAHQDKALVDAAYVRLLERALGNARFTAIATHDEAIVARARELIAWRSVPADRYEFQMLYGIATGLQRRVVAAGHPLRIAAPYGPTWFAYLMRRLAERPANLTFFLRNALR
jgi:proline dehydrogenase